MFSGEAYLFTRLFFRYSVSRFSINFCVCMLHEPTINSQHENSCQIFCWVFLLFVLWVEIEECYSQERFIYVVRFGSSKLENAKCNLYYFLFIRQCHSSSINKHARFYFTILFHSIISFFFTFDADAVIVLFSSFNSIYSTLVHTKFYIQIGFEWFKQNVENYINSKIRKIGMPILLDRRERNAFNLWCNFVISNRMEYGITFPIGNGSKRYTSSVKLLLFHYGDGKKRRLTVNTIWQHLAVWLR